MTNSIQASFFRFDEEDGRARLDFHAVEKRCPELADRVRLIRSRAKNLEKNFREDAQWALNWFSRVTFAAMIIAGFAIVVGSGMAFWGVGSFAGAVTLSVGTIAALIAASSQAFGWHKRFGAMFAARWAMTGLVTRIDQQVVQMAMTTETAGGLTEEDRARLDSAITDWLKHISEIMAMFGMSYGAAIEPITLPNLRGKSE